MRGKGGFGKVLSVKDLTSGKHVALKYCTESDVEHIRRFQREVRIMASIDHENVMTVLHANVEFNPPYFTMPLAVQSVSDIIHETKGNIAKTMQVFEGMCKGINSIPTSGHTHRDIKPDNVLVFDGGKIVVSDLGLAKMDERDTTALTRAISCVLS
ncbi:protein kinase domain-containing protein [Paenibacillus mendelii]|uniref:non-specific serine/threonine protein kinase n=1 Tax=Paenibacillus mendelii TaxID=206163 RepID=A0ABV6J5V4_9BACL|nr:protein kinase [Paenibacillus mendelii]MCQ6559414.1 protein kinase [Paenibacillus mendelii]